MHALNTHYVLNDLEKRLLCETNGHIITLHATLNRISSTNIEENVFTLRVAYFVDERVYQHDHSDRSYAPDKPDQRIQVPQTLFSNSLSNGSNSATKLDKVVAEQHHQVENFMAVSEEDAEENEELVEAVEADQTS